MSEKVKDAIQDAIALCDEILEPSLNWRDQGDLAKKVKKKLKTALKEVSN